MDKVYVTPDRVRELFNYDPETGIVTRKITVGRRGMAGATVGSLTKKGYLCCRIDGRFYLLHRLIFLYVYGRFPFDCVDHRNGIRTDNRLCNLRDATNAENMQNMKAKAGYTSKFPGVCWHKRSLRWRASICLNRKWTHLGYFLEEADAYQAYARAKFAIHKFQPVAR